MTTSKTLLELAGAAYAPARLRDAGLILIDMQNEYCSGPVAATGRTAAPVSGKVVRRAGVSCRA